MTIVKFSDSDGEGRGRSNNLWHGCPRLEIKDDFVRGVLIEDDFTEDLLAERYLTTQAGSSGTFALDDAIGGVALLDCASSTVTQGANVQTAGATGSFITPKADSVIWFETRLKVVDVASAGPEFFVGLSEYDTSIIAGSANTSANHIGFGSITDNMILLGNSENASAAHTGVTTNTLVDGTWVKLGFKVTGIDKVEWYVDGAKIATTGINVATANIPIVGMKPSFVCQSDGTADPITHIDWYSCAQEFDS